ncbi:hypothetical protein [Streptomyces cavernicola]|uniref:Uncharacterized protein n=1 Tax=Streptomyces cavernicola TaxID=3043613 RepID=A0ABT6SBZ1_9ACTN|nr:hypothetical protein [Streptomyces sp. B-S-A6]MDI3405464.1 hypothetical protein [Streptomyces sp. B-S-A6]
MQGRGDNEQGSVHIHNEHGSVVFGNDNRVRHVEGVVPPSDPDPHEKLLDAVRELRADLARLVENDAATALDAELEGAQGEIEQTGQAAPDRLGRLRQALADAGAVTGMFASAAAVSQAVGALLGG